MYKYEEQLPKLLTEEGVLKIIEMRDRINRLMEKSGAVKVDKVLAGDAWESLACIDWLIKYGGSRRIGALAEKQEDISVR